MTSGRRWLKAWTAVAVVASGWVVAAHAQNEPRDPQRSLVSRAELEALKAQRELAATSLAYSETLRRRARAEAGLIETRLREGDFTVGDRVLLVVEGESTLSDTFTVASDRVLRLAEVGAIPLGGVLRSELEAHLRAAMARFLREPRVRARSLIRISIEGAVSRPGFYSVPSEAPVTDALMLAGGPAPDATVDRLEVERAGRRILAAAELKDAIVQGWTVDQLGLQAGDRITVPKRRGGLGRAEGPVRTISILLTIPLTIFAVFRLF